MSSAEAQSMFARLRSSDDARAELIERRIERWKEQKRRSRDWVNFADIAEWCARESGSIRPDDRKMTATYQQLGESLASGEFEEGGRSRVVYPEALILASYPVRIRMPRELYAACLGPKPCVDVLECCWIPRGLARRWLVNKRVPLPPWLSSEDAAQGNGAGTIRSNMPGVAASRAAPTPAATVAAKRRTNGYDWREDDAPLVAEMEKLIATKKARSAEDAARAVVGRAKGHGTEDSKVKRLAKRYRDTCGVQPTTGFE